MAQFEEYFQRADLDRDGRISGHEAIAFFQGSNLSKQVLAQIWMHADQNHTGYLSRPEFYNALKLVTVAQSKRDLTPDMVKAALYGPASAKIPAPQINLAAIPVPQPNSKVAAPSLQTGASALPSSQNFGIGGQAPSTTTINQQFGRAPSTTTTNQFGLAPSTAGMNQFGLASSTTGTNQFGLAPSTTGTNHLRAPSTTGTNQFGLAPSTTGTNQFGLAPSTAGMNQQFRPVQPSSTGMNQQFWQVQPSSTSTNQQFGQSQLSSTGMNQQFGQAPLSANTNKQFFPSQGNQSIGSHLSMPSGSVSHPSHGAVSPNIPSAVSMVGPGLSNSNNDWFVGKTGAASTGPTTQVLKGVSPSNGPSPQDTLSTFLSTAEKDPRGLVGSGNGSTLNSMVGGDVLSANQSSSQQLSSGLQQPTTSLLTSSAIVPVTSEALPSAKVDPFEALQSTLVKPSSGGQAMPNPSVPKPNQPVLTQVTSSSSLSGVSPGVGNFVSEQSQPSWPKMTRPSIQKYAKVFMEVDTDRDGKITGVQARNLFLSWRLPREVLKQVWDLSDQDSDSMLSLREFCIALYLMERYREGHPLPSILPNNVMLDETLLSLAGPPPAYGSMGWVPSTGLPPQQGVPGAQPTVPSNMRTPMQPIVSQADSSMQFNQQNGRGAMIDTSHANQHSNGEENSHSTKGPEATETNEKVDNKENVLLDSREKLEFYRTKMQDLVLYKSRCDNQLNEITERARSDKGEAELLERKYQEKYKQVAEIHSKLTIEEASFREIQARKMELHQAIIKMEQGGSVDGILQVRSDRLQSDLEELLKHLTDRCKKHAVQVKSSVLIELPPGWQPGIPEIATLWDEEWDKFEDEGFSFDVPVAANAKSASVQREDSSPTRSFSPNSVSNADVMSEGPFTVVTNAFETESVYSADESKSPQGTPGSQIAYESPSQGYSADHFTENSDGDAETHRSFDEPTWGNFDNNDDVDSVWGFSTKDSDHGKHEEKYFFGSKDFGASPEGTDSPQAESAFNKNSQFNFEDSVPGTPLSRAGNSPPRYSVESRDPFFDNLSRYDSFNVQDHGSSPRRENLSRFDSMNSTMGFDHSSNYSFDESDPFGSSGPFKVSSETPKKDYDSHSTF